MNELQKILSVKRPKVGLTELFQSRLHELMDPTRFYAPTTATAAFTVTIDRDGTPTPVTVRVMKMSLNGEPLFTVTWTRTVRYQSHPDDDSKMGYQAGTSDCDTVTETSRTLDWLPQEVQDRARELATTLDDQLKNAWRASLQDFLDYYDLSDWERLKEDAPDLDPERARQELEALLN